MSLTKIDIFIGDLWPDQNMPDVNGVSSTSQHLQDVKTKLGFDHGRNLHFFQFVRRCFKFGDVFAPLGPAQITTATGRSIVGVFFSQFRKIFLSFNDAFTDVFQFFHGDPFLLFVDRNFVDDFTYFYFRTEVWQTIFGYPAEKIFYL